MAVRIRLAGPADGEAIADIYRPVVQATAISFEAVAPGREEMARRINDTLPSYPWLVCEIGGEIAGYACAARHRVRAAYQWSVDTSVYISETRRRLGVGRALYQSLFGVLAAQGFFNAYAGIALPNAASVGLHESMGFERIGVYRQVGYKFGQWHDVGWWQRMLQPHRLSPEPPLEVPAVRALPEWDRLVSAGLRSIRRVEEP